MHFKTTDHLINYKLHLLILSILIILFCSSSVSARDVTLTWDPNQEPDISHYIVYWGTSSGDYTENSGDIGLVTEYSVTIPDNEEIYYFATTAVDEDGLESDFSNEVNTNDDGILQIISVKSNWNLVSIYNIPDDTSIENALEPIMDDIISVWAYENGEWQVYVPENPDISDLEEILPGKGFWIQMRENAEAELEILGIAPVDTVALSEGWNLVGYNSSTSNNMAEAISSIAENVESVWAFIDGQWKVYETENPDFSDLTSMEPGYGYWLNVTTPCTWAN